MTKEQRRGNKEARKPKTEKAAPTAAAEPLLGKGLLAPLGARKKK